MNYAFILKYFVQMKHSAGCINHAPTSLKLIASGKDSQTYIADFIFYFLANNGNSRPYVNCNCKINLSWCVYKKKGREAHIPHFLLHIVNVSKQEKKLLFNFI